VALGFYTSLQLVTAMDRDADGKPIVRRARQIALLGTLDKTGVVFPGVSAPARLIARIEAGEAEEVSRGYFTTALISKAKAAEWYPELLDPGSPAYDEFARVADDDVLLLEIGDED
jgi:hypothetical protein